MSIGFTLLLKDGCIFFCNDIIIKVYIDYGIFLGSNDLQLQDVIKEIQDLGLNIEDQGHPADYVGANMKKLKDGYFEFTCQRNDGEDTSTMREKTPVQQWQQRQCIEDNNTSTTIATMPVQ
jgi:hypothetical protein